VCWHPDQSDAYPECHEPLYGLEDTCNEVLAALLSRINQWLESDLVFGSNNEVLRVEILVGVGVNFNDLHHSQMANNSAK